MRITSVESTDLFVGTEDEPLQVVRVHLADTPGGQVAVTVAGDGLSARPAIVDTAGGSRLVDSVDGDVVVEVGVRTDLPVGTRMPIVVDASIGDEREHQDAELVVADTGWTMHLVSHFHYDPVWWNTQAAYTSEWDALDWEGSPRADFQHTGFDLVRAHLELARRDPDYCFVLAEVDYLKPYWDCYPEDRDLLRRLLAEDRLELMGGTYNEPNTNLTHAETTARNAVYGVGFQRDVVGGDPQTAWQLDAFGHDPQFPGMMADAGLTSSSWARGPFHQWGPMLSSPHDRVAGDATVMQFRSEFDWLSPSGRGVLTSYMPNHYSAGWWMDWSSTLADAMEQAYRLFSGLKPVAATRNVLLPVGTDYSPPNRWVTAVIREWNARYLWPRFECSLPKRFFAAVRRELAERGAAPSPQTRDMNPVYTGKDVSYIDTKQAQREAETALLDAEKFATLACLFGSAVYPDAALDKAWRQLVFGAHHDGITGSESDQVYLDLLTGWREALELGTQVRDRALAHITAQTDTRGAGRAVVVHNSASFVRTDLVRTQVQLDPTGAIRLQDDDGNPVPAVVEPAGAGSATLTFLARDVPGVGHRSYRIAPTDADSSAAAAADGQWVAVEGTTIENALLRLSVDPERGGCMDSLVHLPTGRQILADGRLGNELLVYDEYPEHPEFHEGPWHLVPSGPCVSSSDRPADSVVRETSALGQRITVTGSVGPVRYTKVVTLWDGLDQVDCATHVDEFTGSDHLVRVRFGCDVPGALPVSEVGDAVVGRGFAHPDVDSRDAPWTLDNPAYGWFGLSSTARVVLRGDDGDGDGLVGKRAFGVAELVVGTEEAAAPLCRDLAVALVRAGVTSTTSVADGSRYGLLAVDSNLPDLRISVGSPTQNPFTAAVLDAADPAYARAVEHGLAEDGQAVVLVPAERPLAQAWVPNADLRGPRALPVLVVAGMDEDATRRAVEGIAADLDDAEVDVGHVRVPEGTDPPAENLDDFTVAVLNRGIPGFAVDRSGALHLSLLRSCTGWPSGVWIDPPRRTTPDGSGFQLQHWTHTFSYAVTASPGDWRASDTVAQGYRYNHPLHAVVAEPHQGTLPATAALMTVEPSPHVVLTTMKPAGNPLARGSSEPADPRRAVTLRWYESTGRPAQVRVSSPIRLTAGSTADLLETPVDPVKCDDGVLVTDVHGCQITTLVATPDSAALLPGSTPLGPEQEPAQPVYTRYWLHNKGPAPLGYQPVSIHLHPARATTTGGPMSLRVTLASDRTDETAVGWVRVLVPDGWVVEGGERPFELAPGGHSELDVTVATPADVRPGTYFVAARVEVDGQTFEDVGTVQVSGNEQPVDTLLEVLADPDGVTLEPGASSRLKVRLRNNARSEIRGEAHVVSPYGTWSFIRPWSQPFTLAPDEEGEVTIDVDVPHGTRPGQWWALVKLMWFGRVAYGPAVPVQIRARP